MSSTNMNSNSNSSSSSSDNSSNNCNPETGVSICIPYVHNFIRQIQTTQKNGKPLPMHRAIKNVIINCNWGYVQRVDVVHCGKHKRAFIHFAPGKWNMRSDEARQVLEALRAGGEVQVVYAEPWFWKIRASGSKKPDEAPKRREQPSRPVIRLPGASTPETVTSEFREYDASAQNDEENRRPVRNLTVDTGESKQGEAVAYDDVNTLSEDA